MKDYDALEKLLGETGEQIESMLAIRGCTREADLVYGLTDLYVTMILQYFVKQDTTGDVRIKPESMEEDIKECFKKIEMMY